MSKQRFRTAIYAVMTGLVIAAGGSRTVVSAADCAIPKVLAVGKSYEFVIGLANVYVTVIEIDRQTCWIKGHRDRTGEGGEGWYNLRQVSVIGEEPTAPAQTQPRQRR